MSKERFSEILQMSEGPSRTAAMAAWVQGLFSDRERVPVLIGGAVVELLTGGGYTTGDLDFAGTVPPETEQKLRAEGFERTGRHWIHQRGQIFLDFPAAEVDPLEGTSELVVENHRVLVLSPEAVLVDRLAAWQFWGSTTDAVNAFLVWKACSRLLDESRLDRLVEEREVAAAFDRLLDLGERFQETDPTPEELERWADSDF